MRNQTVIPSNNDVTFAVDKVPRAGHSFLVVVKTLILNARLAGLQIIGDHENLFWLLRLRNFEDVCIQLNQLL